MGSMMWSNGGRCEKLPTMDTRWMYVPKGSSTCPIQPAAPGKFEVKSSRALEHSNDVWWYPPVAIPPHTSRELLAVCFWIMDRLASEADGTGRGQLSAEPFRHQIPHEGQNA